MKTDDYYQLLGVGRRASQERLRHAFRSRLLLVHPDQNAGDAQATEQTREVVEAYRVLSNPRTRRDYDNSLGVPIPTPAAHAPPTTCRYTTLYRAIIMACFITLAILTAMLISGGAFGNHGPVFTGMLIEQPHSAAPKSFPTLPEPSVMDTMEWYQARAYHLSLGNRWATDQLVRTYSDAARQATQHGDTLRAKFYLDCLNQTAASDVDLPFPHSPSG
ncbi:MAG: J domain-containing protein [Armatimonadetes bacterium]|nr:J domain-containing protein [Armatimonadota bacterium]